MAKSIDAWALQKPNGLFHSWFFFNESELNRYLVWNSLREARLGASADAADAARTAFEQRGYRAVPVTITVKDTE